MLFMLFIMLCNLFVQMEQEMLSRNAVTKIAARNAVKPAYNMYMTAYTEIVSNQ